jgi:hypothetical protein
MKNRKHINYETVPVFQCYPSNPAIVEFIVIISEGSNGLPEYDIQTFSRAAVRILEQCN